AALRLLPRQHVREHKLRQLPQLPPALRREVRLRLLLPRLLPQPLVEGLLPLGLRRPRLLRPVHAGRVLLVYAGQLLLPGHLRPLRHLHLPVRGRPAFHSSPSPVPGPASRRGAGGGVCVFLLPRPAPARIVEEAVRHTGWRCWLFFLSPPP